MCRSSDEHHPVGSTGLEKLLSGVENRPDEARIIARIQVSVGFPAGHRSVSAGVYSRAAAVPYAKERRGRAVKKLLLVALAAIGGLLVYRQIQADRAEQDLWTEATDSVPAGSGV